MMGESLGVSKTATIKAVHRVCKVLSEVGERFISFPTGRQPSDVKAAFYKIAGENVTIFPLSYML